MANTRTVFVIHAYEPSDGSRMLRLNLGDEWWNLPTGEPVEIEQGEFFAEKLIETHGPVYGIVEAPSVKTRTGISIDPDACMVMARKALRAAEDNLLNKWVMEQRSDRVRANLPVLPPTGRVAEIVTNRQIDLKKTYGFQTVGEETASTTDHSGQAKAGSEDVEALKRENEALRAEGTARDAMMSEIMGRLSKVEAVVN